MEVNTEWNKIYALKADEWNNVDGPDAHVIRFMDAYVQADKPTNTILDCGCGSGRNTKVLKQYFNVVTGIDISDFIIARNKRTARDINYDVCDITTDSLDRYGKQDAILDAGLLHSVNPSHHKDIINKYHTALNDSGWLGIRIFKTPTTDYNTPIFSVNNIPIYGMTIARIYELFEHFDIKHIEYDNADQYGKIDGCYYIHAEKICLENNQ